MRRKPGVSTVTASHGARSRAAMRQAARTSAADCGAGPTATSTRSPAGHGEPMP